MLPDMMYPQPLKIGSVTLKHRVLLAPIAGYCDMAFRLVVRSCGGVGLASTDLLCPEGVLRENRRSMELAATCQADSPLCMQLYGSDANRMAEAARWAEDRGADVIDINMGCPVDKITKKDGGSRLLCDLPNTMKLVQTVRSAIRNVPLTAKLRLGWDDQSIVAPRLAYELQESGIAAVTIHGRTTEMRFGGEARLDGIAAVVAAAPRIPVIGNGDIRSPEDAKRMMEVTGCAAVMIGRAALSMPWLLRDIASYLETGIIPPEPSVADKCMMMIDHFDHLAGYRDMRTAALEFRKRVSWYAKTMNPCRVLRDPMRSIHTREQFMEIIHAFLEWRREWDAGAPHARAMEEMEAVGAAQGL